MMSKVLCLFCFENFTEEGRVEKRRVCKLQNKAHRTFDTVNTLSPVYLYLERTPAFLINLPVFRILETELKANRQASVS